ncbi:MAG: 50S ribosomal protein L24e [Candidatus Micrarchaeota archaeon]
MAYCIFCGKQIQLGTGFTLFKKDGMPQRFCSRKCQRYLQMGRKPQNYKWAKKA